MQDMSILLFEIKEDLDLSDPTLGMGPELPDETHLPGGERHVMLRHM